MVALRELRSARASGDQGGSGRGRPMFYLQFWFLRAWLGPGHGTYAYIKHTCCAFLSVCVFFGGTDGVFKSEGCLEYPIRSASNRRTPKSRASKATAESALNRRGGGAERGEGANGDRDQRRRCTASARCAPRSWWSGASARWRSCARRWPSTRSTWTQPRRRCWGGGRGGWSSKRVPKGFQKGAFCWDVRTFSLLPTNGFVIKPLKVKLLAGEQKATE